MSASRLSTALADGLVDLPDGTVSLMRPPASFDVTGLPPGRLSVIHSFYPEAMAWANAGYPLLRNLEPCDTAIVVVPRAKALARAMVAEACAKARFVIIDGQKTDGTDSLFKEMRKRLGELPSLTKAHGRMFWCDASAAFADWAAPATQAGPDGFVTTAGVFSDGEIDAGSAFLAEHLPQKLPLRMADLGAGWGYLSHAALRRAGVATIDLIEAEALSLDCARLNVTDPRAAFHWADATKFTAPAYDGIVMNPPFHTGRSADPSLGRSFITAAGRLLKPNGRLWMVANRHLPYEPTLNASFRSVDSLASNGAFKLFLASKPRGTDRP
ncbi:class I SAM-dependent methyltransferase [Yoonia sp.]|uniref:class I SAM-dependent methyltransferase n=1 Tax=Yoonia sp. TaxID=2212373 RepID=UPI002FDA88DF